MPDFPGSFVSPAKTFISSHGPAGLIADRDTFTASGSSAQTWPVASKALFMPFILETPALARAMAIQVSVQSGNLDVGIYTLAGASIVTAGTTAVGAAGIQVINITDTWLATGTYFMALAIDNTTASIFMTTGTSYQSSIFGIQEMGAAFVLPATATFANTSDSKQPLILLQCGNATI